ncbi:MAG: pentapeptide repeat-containing protein [Acidimicrobiales bacterium]|nr:pentapeptide repeat-containing protein [Acidimicrobiales bacterium]MCB9395629.1 pentapeptide repeat-containing protein [Acidimicrobiaceae bacterium]
MSTPVSSAPVSSADVEAAADTTTTAAVERTTTTVPPTPVPLGVRWTETTTLAHGVKGIQGERLVQLGDELWAMVDLLDATLTFVSRDGGATFADVQIAPPQQGSTHVTGILRRPDGGYLAYGSLGTNCYSQDQLTEGYLGFQICLRSTGMTWVSDDGAAWEQIEPSGLAGPGDSVFRLIGMVSTPSGYVAAATIASLDWHSRLYTSPDGRAWTLAREMRGEGTGPMSIESLLSDGANVMVLGAEHTCAEPQSANNGYQPDVDFVFRPRVYVGTSADDLTLVPDVDVPFVQLADPNENDCAALDSFDRAQLPRVELGAQRVGDRIALVADPDPGTGDRPSEDEQASGGRRQVAFLVAGAWQATSIDQVPILDRDRTSSHVVAAPGTPTGFSIVEVDDGRRLQVHARLTADSGDGVPAFVAVEQPFVADSIGDVIGVGTTLVAIGDRTSTSGLSSTHPFQVPRDVVLWTSVETSGEPDSVCDLAPGGSCRFGDLSTVAGYPDFSGRDLAGVDLASADLGESNFDGAVLVGAVMWSATGSAASFVGADLSGAQLQYGDLGSVAGADLSGANLTDARVDDATGAILVGAVLRGTSLPLTAPTDLVGALTAGVRLELSADHEWSLGGLDLSDASIDAMFTDARTTVRIVDLAGSVLEWANFSRADLTGADVTGIDLSKTVFDDASLCPDGLPPATESYSGGCDR